MGKDAVRLDGEPNRIPVSGELAPLVDEFRKVLNDGGFNRPTVTTHTHLIADLSEWLTMQRLTAARFTIDELPVFLAGRRPYHVGVGARRGTDAGFPPRA
jgi:hypothetical protein